MHKPLARAFVALGIVAYSGMDARAAEYGFSSYGLGTNAFGAGVTPPPGTYVTAITVFYSAHIGTSVDFGNVTLNAGAKADYFTSALNMLNVPQHKILGGNLGLSVTVPVSHADIEATVGLGPFVATREVDGWGLGDIASKVQLGWQHGNFAHTVYLQAVAPTGRWDPGFAPNIGLNRPNVDTGWAFTWTDSSKKLQLNGAVGVTFNFENTGTDYRSGNDFHFEWAAALEFAPGLLIGVVGYDYRQLTDDSGAGARLGPFRSRVDAIGPGLSYTTLVGVTPVIINARHYKEFNAENRFEGSSTWITGTVRF